ncbi:MAG: DNA gyrase subunit A, partial [Chromatiales bacterium]|nr:DNA gyrase subunit A [Chromatiales bacterium]
KKTPLTAFSRRRANGIIAIDLVEDDQLVGVDITDGQQDIMLFSTEGKSVRFKEADVRSMGRVSRGVRGIRLPEEHKVNALIIADEGCVLTATENGFGKRTRIEDYPTKGRGGKGVIAIQTSDRNGAVVGATLVNDEDEIMLITDGGTLVRTRVAEVSVVGRNTQGVKLINLTSKEKLIGLSRIVESDSDDEDDESEEGSEETSEE